MSLTVTLAADRNRARNLAIPLVGTPYALWFGVLDIDGSYVGPGGEALTPATFGLRSIIWADVSAAAATDGSAHLAAFVDNGALRLYTTSNGNELANTTAVSHRKLSAFLVGLAA